MAYENNDRRPESVYSQRVKAGKRRTYFFDVRETRGNDYYLTITESRKKFNDDGYERHKLFLYKEDFNKFLKGITEAIDFVKTDLMPDFDFDAFNHEFSEEGYDHPQAPAAGEETPVAPAPPVSESQAPVTEPSAKQEDEVKDPEEPTNPTQHEEVDKW